MDVREPEEWQHGHIDGSVPAPRGLLEFFADPTSPRHKEALDPRKRTIVLCASGARASLAALTLKTMGYEDVAILDGGLKAWTEAGLPLTSTSTRVSDHPCAPGYLPRNPLITVASPHHACALASAQAQRVTCSCRPRRFIGGQVGASLAVPQPADVVVATAAWSFAPPEEHRPDGHLAYGPGRSPAWDQEWHYRRDTPDRGGAWPAENACRSRTSMSFLTKWAGSG